MGIIEAIVAIITTLIYAVVCIAGIAMFGLAVMLICAAIEGRKK